MEVQARQDVKGTLARWCPGVVVLLGDYNPLVNIQKTDGKIIIFNGKIHYFNGNEFNSYVKLPEGNPHEN